MDITKLPFDAETMLQGLRPWVECESPTFEAARVNAMMDIAARECALSGGADESQRALAENIAAGESQVKPPAQRS